MKTAELLLPESAPFTVQQIRRGSRNNFGIISHILHKIIFCGPSLEPSRGDGSNEGSQHMFSLRNKKLSLNYPPKPPLIRSSAFIMGNLVTVGQRV